MQVHFSYQHGSRNPELDKMIDTQVHKLAPLLVRFSPDLVHLHGMVDFSTPKKGPLCSLNLWLPTARLRASEQGRDLPAAVRASFNNLREQVKKHNQVLRREGEWKRQRYKSRHEDRKLQAGELRLQDRQQLRDYLDQVLPQLKLFIARELRYLEMSSALRQQAREEEEIINEVVARVLENHQAFSTDPAPFHLLLRESIHVLNGGGSEAAGSNPEKSRNSFADLGLPSGLSEGAPDPVDLCLALLPAKKRQVYVLHALEGFSFGEAAQVLGQLPSEVEETFQAVSRAVSGTLQANRPTKLPPKSPGGKP